METSLLEYLILRFIYRQMYVVHHHPSQHIFISLLSMRKPFKKQMPAEACQRSVRASCVEDFRGLDPRVSEPAQISSSGDVTALLGGMREGKGVKYDREGYLNRRNLRLFFCRSIIAVVWLQEVDKVDIKIREIVAINISEDALGCMEAEEGA